MGRVEAVLAVSKEGSPVDSSPLIVSLTLIHFVTPKTPVSSVVSYPSSFTSLSVTFEGLKETSGNGESPDRQCSRPR